MLDVHELRVFLAAAETENFSEAGRRLNISQPAVSMQIRALEESLGIQLFHRTGRHIVLSDPGRKLMPMARDLINRVAQIEESMESVRGNVVGLLRLGCGSAAGRYILPRLVARLRENYPQVKVQCTVTTNERAVDLLQDGHVQVTFTNLADMYKDLEFQPYLKERFIYIVPNDHQWVERDTPVTFDEILQENLVTYSDDTCEYRALQEGFAALGVGMEGLDPVMVVSTAEAAAVSIQQGIGTGFVSQVVVKESIECGRVVPLDVADLDISHTFYLVRHTKRPASSAQAAFWDMAMTLTPGELGLSNSLQVER